MEHPIKLFISQYKTQMKFTGKLLLLSSIVGVSVGLIATLFHYCLDKAIEFRLGHFPVVFFLPLCGIGVVALYRLFRNDADGGTNIVLSAIQSDARIPLRMAPCIFFGTIATQFVGGSAGREGAALQLGGSIGGAIGRAFHLDRGDVKIMIMCGMSAAVSALFGAPIAAAIFSLEVISIGIMHYSALVPCVVASFIAKGIGVCFGIEKESFIISSVPTMTLKTALIIGILAVICALVSMFFCMLLHQAEYMYKRRFSNRYLRAAVGGAIVLGLTLIVGDQTYNGPGMDLVGVCINTGTVFPLAFVIKMIFTAATLGCGGFKGGEIVPSFCVGATLGCLFGSLIGFSPELCTAVGMGALFCGVTNSPLASLLICFEIFGGEGMPYYLIAIAVSYMFSGYYSLYNGQKIMYSKYRTVFINRKTNDQK